jgi:hypothetical protein
MTLRRGVAEVFAAHVMLELECIDRKYRNVHLRATRPIDPARVSGSNFQDCRRESGPRPDTTSISRLAPTRQ